MFLKLYDADVSVALLDHLGADAAEADDLAGEREGQRHFDVLAGDRQHDLRAGFTPHSFDGLVQRQPACHRVVDLDDEVPGLDAGAKRGSVLDRRDDLDDAVFDADFDSQAAKLALGGDLQFLECVGIEEIRVRVQPVDHAVDGFAYELVVGDGLDVVALDPSEDG